MRLNLILLVTSLAGLLLPGMSYAHKQPVSDTLALRVYFRQGYAAPESDYRANGERMQAFVSALKTIQEDPTRRLKTIHVAAGCSPEGTAAANRRLSAKRVSNVAAYLRSHLALPDSLVQERSLGIDWQGLIELVEVSDMRHRDEVLALLRNTPEWIVRNGQVVDGRMRRLGMLHGGRPYWYMYEHLFPGIAQFGRLCRQRNRTPPRSRFGICLRSACDTRQNAGRRCPGNKSFSGFGRIGNGAAGGRQRLFRT